MLKIKPLKDKSLTIWFNFVSQDLFDLHLEENLSGRTT